ncbi:type VI secretion system-associated protein TagF [Ningiella sp. W23]|uniref:type VI secretion system-associated protein TagF n=1 Tax=Ningiella sp. W23 TaxID=3023715 RepID=UPI00375764CA
MKIGFFGKLPSYGDFIQRNVSPEIAEYWDNWILQAMEHAKSDLDSQWKECYFTSPIWRFHLQSGVVCENTLSGLMMPSIDSMGRCYPFFVVCCFDAKSDVIKLASMIDDCHAKCEELILQLLGQERPDLDQVCSEIGKCYRGIVKQHVPKSQPSPVLTLNEIYQYDGDASDNLTQVNEHFLSHCVSRQFASLSIFSRAQSHNIHAQYRYYDGMPNALAYSSFLGDNLPK